jgi:hypothetical protein
MSVVDGIEILASTEVICTRNNTVSVAPVMLNVLARMEVLNMRAACETLSPRHLEGCMNGNLKLFDGLSAVVV